MATMHSSAPRHLNIMQVHDFYDAYLSSFYAARPHLRRAGWAEHNKALIGDAFSGIHILAPYLSGYGKTEFVVGNARHAQSAWCRERGIDADQHEQTAIVRMQIETFKPDILYIEPTRYNAAFLRSLSHKPLLTLGWRGADIHMDMDFSGFDVILSALPRLLKVAKTMGAGEGVYFAPGMPAWISREVTDIPQDTDLVFVGSISPTQHTRRRQLLHALAEAASKRNFSLALHLSCPAEMITPAMRPYMRKPVFGLAMHKALRKGRIVFDTQGSIHLVRPDGARHLDLAAGDTANMRLFEATGGGSLLITDALPGVSRFFEPDKEIVTFRDEEDLITKILYFLSHAEEREAIAARGQSRCLSDWSMARATKSFMEIVHQRIGKM